VGSLASVDALTEPSSFARLRRADNEMKLADPKNKGFCGMFPRSAVAPDAGVYFSDNFKHYQITNYSSFVGIGHPLRRGTPAPLGDEN